MSMGAVGTPTAGNRPGEWSLGSVPASLLRGMFCLIGRACYRLRVLGREHVPARGPALLVCNHISYADGYFIRAAVKRPIRFVVGSDLADSTALERLGRVMRLIPIASTVVPQAIDQAARAVGDALRRGELVCIFAEGQLARTDAILGFRQSIEKTVRELNAPIIPVFVDRVWGTIFSCDGGRLVWRRPIQRPQPITVGFGEPMPPTARGFQVRQAVQELGAECVARRKPVQKSLHRLFVRRAARHPFRFCMADSSGREATFGKALAGMIAMSRVLRRRLGPEPMVGVLLPPSVASSIANWALLAAGKVPINLNYTASSETIASCVEQCRIKTIITSPLMMKRLRLTLPLEPTPIEELFREIGPQDRFWAAAGAYVLPGWVTEHWLLRLGGSTPDDLVTVIFSSGSTGEPKGVTLSHHNVLSNCEAAIQVLKPTPDDRIIGLLPLFHSFGFLVDLWVPFLIGAGAVYHNNPLDSKEIGELVGKYGGTILIATPTFLRSYTRKISAEQFKTVRLVVTGAEKLPREVADGFREKFGVDPMEGYGCTELSPVAAVNVADFVGADGRRIGNKPGTVGHPIPGVAARIVDPDTDEELPPGVNGLLLIKGPNVMQGYWKKPELTEPVIRDGWYVTGDVANLDDDGFITITDRLSRFSKIGGEMVPHIKIEEAIRQCLNTDDQGAAVVGVPDPSRGERLVVLHPPLPISSDELWKKLNASSLPKLWVPARDAFHEVAELPYLGTGKLDLRRIKEMAREQDAAHQPAHTA